MPRPDATPPTGRKGDEKTSEDLAPDATPELHNAEQDDEDAQAQTVSDEVLRGSDLGLSDTAKVPTGDDSDDVQDLVDHMRQMETSGQIDMGAFAGERNDDDEEDRYGSAAEEE